VDVEALGHVVGGDGARLRANVEERLAELRLCDGGEGVH
jgi:hypothetical protein